MDFPCSFISRARDLVCRKQRTVSVMQWGTGFSRCSPPAWYRHDIACFDCNHDRQLSADQKDRETQIDRCFKRKIDMINFLLKGLMRDRSRSLFPVLTVFIGVFLTVFMYSFLAHISQIVTPKVGSILKLLTNDIQGGKIQSEKEELNGFKRVIWEIPNNSCNPKLIFIVLPFYCFTFIFNCNANK
jgi:hypothetical protein